MERRLPSESLPALPPNTLTRPPLVGAFSHLMRRRGSEMAPRVPGPGVLPLAAGGGPPRSPAGARVLGGWSHAAGCAHSLTHVAFARGQLQADSPAPSRKWEDRVLRCSRCQQALSPHLERPCLPLTWMPPGTGGQTRAQRGPLSQRCF